MDDKYKLEARAGNTSRGPGTMNKNWGTGPINTNWGPGPEAGVGDQC